MHRVLLPIDILTLKVQQWNGNQMLDCCVLCVGVNCDEVIRRWRSIP